MTASAMLTPMTLEDGPSSAAGDATDVTSRWPTTFWQQIVILTGRSFKQTRGNVWTAVNFLQSFAVALIAGGAWFQTGPTEVRRLAVYFPLPEMPTKMCGDSSTWFLVFDTGFHSGSRWLLLLYCCLLGLSVIVCSDAGTVLRPTRTALHGVFPKRTTHMQICLAPRTLPLPDLSSRAQRDDEGAGCRHVSAKLLPVGKKL